VLVAGFSSYYSFLLFFFSFFFGVVMLFIITNMSFYSSSFSGKHSVGPNDIFTTLSNIRTTLAGDWPPEKLVLMVKMELPLGYQDPSLLGINSLFVEMAYK